MTSTAVLRMGTVVQNYRVERVLGVGGFGITYLATDLTLDSFVALKEYFPRDFAARSADRQTVVSTWNGGDGAYAWGREKFVQEANALAKLQHSNIVGVNFLFNANGTSYMAIDFIEGQSLGEWLDGIKRWPTQDELDQISFPLLSALETIHNKGLMHRDIKPNNIMIGRNFTPIFIDFGTARQLVAERSHTAYAPLTHGYAPAEQYSRSLPEQGAWTDIYALAATFYKAMAGHPPPDGFERLGEDHCVPAVKVGAHRYDRDFLEAIDWGLRPQRKDRPRTVGEWRRAFGEPAQEPVLAAGQTKPKSWSWFRRN